MAGKFGYTPAPRRVEKRKHRDGEENSNTSPSTSTMRRPAKTSKTIYNVPTSNKFKFSMYSDGYSDDEDNPEEEEEDAENRLDDNMSETNEKTMINFLSTSTPKKRETKKPKKVIKPPPVIIHGNIKDQTALHADLKKIAENRYYIKNTRLNTQIHVEKNEDKIKVIELLQSDNIDYHTYTPKESKTHAFILKGLATRPTTEEIKTDLKTKYNIDVTNIYELKKVAFPLYLIITDNKTTLKKLRKEARIVCRTAVSWDIPKNKKGMVQCHRCQMWGHATSNCGSTIRCMICAENHATHECEATEDDIKCINCGEKHKANDINCPVYKSRKEYIDVKRQPQQTAKRTSNVPPPQINNERHFPALKPTTTKTSNPWRKTDETKNSAKDNNNAPGSAILTTNNFQDTFHTLKKEIDELNSLINLNEAIRAITDLNNLLRECKGNKIEKFETIKTFFSNLDVYDI